MTHKETTTLAHTAAEVFNLSQQSPRDWGKRLETVTGRLFYIRVTAGDTQVIFRIWDSTRLVYAIPVVSIARMQQLMRMFIPPTL